MGVGNENALGDFFLGQFSVFSNLTKKMLSAFIDFIRILQNLTWHNLTKQKGSSYLCFEVQKSNEKA